MESAIFLVLLAATGLLTFSTVPRRHLANQHNRHRETTNQDQSASALIARKLDKTSPASFADDPKRSIVLVIDDEEDIRDVTSMLLARKGFKVLTAANGQAGLDLFNRHADQIGVVLLDVIMPGISGEQVSRDILARRPDVRIILSSGYSEETTRQECDSKHNVEFLQKPYTADTLLNKITTAITSS